MIHKLKKYIKSKKYPYIYTIDSHDSDGCKFEVTNSVEEWRVSTLDNEHQFLKKYINEILPNDIVFDIGANIGIYSIHAAKKAAKVYSFEPDPGFRSRLSKNISINEAKDRISIIEWAVSDSLGEVTLYTDGEAGSSPSLKKVGERGEVEVNMNSLDTAINEGLIQPPNLVKMDIEGAEILALRGMKNLLTSNNAPRSIFIELHPVFLKRFDSSIKECKRLLESANYKAEYSDVRDDQEHCIYQKI